MRFQIRVGSPHGKRQQTTIHQDIDQKALLVVDMLSRHIQNKELPAERTVIGVNIVERNSVSRQQ